MCLDVSDADEIRACPPTANWMPWPGFAGQCKTTYRYVDMSNEKTQQMYCERPSLVGEFKKKS